MGIRSSCVLPLLAMLLMGVTASTPIYGHDLIKVSGCHPALNLQQAGGFAGYAPGVWGGRWIDPYGYGYYQPPVTTTNPQLGIHYMNISNKTISSIEFGLIANDHIVAEVRDVGKFTPGAEIKHRFGLSPNVFPLRTGMPQCAPLRITFADGTKWKSPRLPPQPTGFYKT